MNPESTPYATYYELKTAAQSYIGALIIYVKKSWYELISLQNEIDN